MNIGLIAHDAKKILMQNFAIAYRGILSKHDIYATGNTVQTLKKEIEKLGGNVVGISVVINIKEHAHSLK